MHYVQYDIDKIMNIYSALKSWQKSLKALTEPQTEKNNERTKSKIWYSSVSEDSGAM